ncbi:M15 family metallopeptidase [Quadrisphaera sp. DSM 44207]|uniref:M15 family metallopeptidase n=1 Tax=Quadrisphaera sp. DSM 44207 TaxID=1881057 RepID=UPI000B8101AE|nr:M15 family metallopeptidase [Quadrisphaera sp. DSM 44207]
MDGLAGVTARIAEIQGRIASLTSSSATGAPAFAGALDGALAATAPPAAPAGSTAAVALGAEDQLAALRLERASRTSTAMTADGVPVALAGYGNGRVPEPALAPIGRGDHRLWAPAADAFSSLAAAAARDGVQIGVTDSYRSYEQQVDLARRKGLYSQGGLAAEPGTSDHGWGRSLDLDLDATALAWMREHGGEFGFAEDVPREPWHWTYSPPG